MASRTAQLMTLTTCLVAVSLSATLLALPAAAQTANWTLYKPDQKFADVFGRDITINREPPGPSQYLREPTLNDALQAPGNSVLNTFARRAVTSLLDSTAGPSKSCEEVKALELPWVRILSAEMVAAKAPLPAYCKVVGVVDKEIHFEVDLPPAAEWNGKFLMGGSGGFLGNLQNGSKEVALERRYATAVTDTGHKMTDASGLPAAAIQDGGAAWAYNNPERLVNFGYRGTHLAAANVKLVIQAYYGKLIEYSYFSGSSGSGRQAMMEAQRYPDDFQGIIAKCPGIAFLNMALSFAWTQQAIYPTIEDMRTYNPFVSPEKTLIFSDAVTAKCDKIDGLVDGDIADPRKCLFDPLVDLPRCANDVNGPNCFTTRQASTIAKIHAGPSSVTEGQLWPGFVYGNAATPGSWFRTTTDSAYVIGGKPREGAIYNSRHYLLANEMFKYFVFNDPTYDLHSFDFDKDVPKTYAVADIIHSNNPDLAGLKRSGAKLIIQQGWPDWASLGLATADYYERVTRKMGGRDQVMPFARLFMMPSIGHCETPDPRSKTPHRADFLTALEQWVERNTPPDAILAEHVATSPRKGAGASADIVDRSRPLCPYPELATYKGTGSIDKAENFTCQMPAAQ